VVLKIAATPAEEKTYFSASRLHGLPAQGKAPAPRSILVGYTTLFPRPDHVLEQLRAHDALRSNGHASAADSVSDLLAEREAHLLHFH
jgi:hypothetical protein